MSLGGVGRGGAKMQEKMQFLVMLEFSLTGSVSLELLNPHKL